VALDAQGFIWVTNYNAKNVMKIDPNGGPWVKMAKHP
jgi:hypothetical protein